MRAVLKATPGRAVAIEEDQATGAAAALMEDARARLRHRIRGVAGAQHLYRGFCQHHAHDCFAEPGAGNAAGFGVGVTAAADQRRIADATRVLAARAARGSAGDEPALRIDGYRADGAHGMVHVKFRGVAILAAAAPGGAFAIDGQFRGIAQRQALLLARISLRLRRPASCARSIPAIFARAEWDCGFSRRPRRLRPSAWRHPSRLHRAARARLRFRCDPMPASNTGSSSSTTIAASTASSAAPPRDNNAPARLRARGGNPRGSLRPHRQEYSTRRRER